MNLLLISLLLHTSVFLTEGSLLRGSPLDKIIHDAKEYTSTHSSQTFDCDAYKLDGMIPPGEPNIERQEWICEAKFSSTQDEVKTFFFDGDVKRKFNADIPKVAGAISMSIPWSAVDGTKIDILHEGISVNKNNNNRRKLAKKTGTQKVLIVRVIGSDQAPGYWVDDLYDNFFGDENNLSSRYRACSKGRLNLIPARGPLVRKGVINIRINMKVIGTNYRTVSDVVTNKLNAIGGLDYSAKIFIMPDGVDMRGAAAWAVVYGETIWIRNKFSKSPMVQVHEYGHLLGLDHSGKGTGAYSEYFDDTGYMGNRLPWSDEGVKACFNPAKMWYLGWFSWRHTALNPKYQAFSDTIVSLDDVVNDNANNEKMIVKIEGGSDEFFIMYNKAKGVNEGAVGYRDKVVITQQNYHNDISYAMAGLSDGESWTLSNFAGTGKTLVVKNCERRNNQSIDTAQLLIYVQGINDQTCDGESQLMSAQSIENKDRFPTASPTDSPTHGPTFYPTIAPTSSPVNKKSCTDEKGWYDAGGEKFNCAWYAVDKKSCDLYGHRFENFGKTANEACCICQQ